MARAKRIPQHRAPARFDWLMERPAAENRESETAKVKARSSRPMRWWPVVTTVLVLAVGISLLVPSTRHQWALSLVRQPTPYTALSFDQPAALPTHVVEDRPISVSFTIGNQEGRSLVYRYVVQASSTDGAAGETSGRAAVPNGGSRSISAVVRPACSTSPCQVQVSLPGYPVTIDFLADVASAK